MTDRESASIGGLMTQAASLRLGGRPAGPRGWLGAAALVGLVGTMCAANWSVAHVGLVDVGFGLQAPAAVYAVGVTFTLRDIAHRAVGPAAVIAVVIVGAALSTIVSPTFALASGCVFLVSEMADLVVYSPLAKRSWLGAVAVSNTVGLLVDSVLFLLLAFNSLELLWGQVVGKLWLTVAATVGIAAVRGLRGIGPVARAVP